MKKWLYVLSVGGMTGIFLLLYFPAKKAADEREANRLEQVRVAKEKEDAHQREIERLAAADAARRSAELAKEEAAKEAADLKRWQDELDSINGNISAAKTDISRYNNQIDSLTKELASLNANRDQANRDDFDLAKKVELARVDQFTAEMDIQRMVDMIATRADQSSFANPPPPPTKQ